MSFWAMSFAMNAFIYIVPIYCAARAFADFRQGKIVLACAGALCAVVLLAPLVAAYAVPDSEAMAWFLLGFVVISSIGVAIYVSSRTLLDAVGRNFGWALAGGLCIILLILPWVWTFSMPANQVTIG
ncbi:hypothetical protein [Altererythrobacter sp. GH1-8]|uniref:hypothetical protein n=1 Tax=Altererythrobacter sp. GH1-8 TaxID=3349333 RepID=UPI00374DB691